MFNLNSADYYQYQYRTGNNMALICREMTSQGGKTHHSFRTNLVGWGGGAERGLLQSWFSFNNEFHLSSSLTPFVLSNYCIISAVSRKRMKPMFLESKEGVKSFSSLNPVFTSRLVKLQVCVSLKLFKILRIVHLWWSGFSRFDERFYSLFGIRFEHVQYEPAMNNCARTATV